MCTYNNIRTPTYSSWGRVWRCSCSCMTAFIPMQCCACRCFDFVPNLGEAIKKASLVISHAGSGSIFESLSSGCPLIVVPNPLLMDNHQVELAEQLAALKHLVSNAK